MGIGAITTKLKLHKLILIAILVFVGLIFFTKTTKAACSPSSNTTWGENCVTACAGYYKRDKIYTYTDESECREPHYFSNSNCPTTNEAVGACAGTCSQNSECSGFNAVCAGTGIDTNAICNGGAIDPNGSYGSGSKSCVGLNCGVVCTSVGSSCTNRAIGQSGIYTGYDMNACSSACSVSTPDNCTATSPGLIYQCQAGASCQSGWYRSSTKYCGGRPETCCYQGVAGPTVTLEVKQGDDPPSTGYSGGPLTVADGSRITLRWTTGNSPDTCTASGDWNGSRVTNGGVESQAPSPGNHTYTITCTNSGGTASDTVNVAVSSLPSVDLKVNNQDGPVSVLQNTPVTVSWTPGNTTSCAGTVSGGFAWVGVKNASAGTHSETASSTGGTGTRVFSITCSNASGQTISDEVYVNVSPIVDCNLTNITNLTSTSATANINTTGYDRVEWFLDGSSKGHNYGGSADFGGLSPLTNYRVTAIAYLDADPTIRQWCNPPLDFSTPGTNGYTLSCSAGPNLSVSNNPGTPTCSGCANGYDNNTSNYAFLGSNVPSSNPVAGGHNISVTVNGNNAGSATCAAPGGGGGGGGGTPTPIPTPANIDPVGAWITVIAKFRNPNGSPYTGAGLNGAALPVYLGIVKRNAGDGGDQSIYCDWDTWVWGQEINATWPPPRLPNLYLSNNNWSWGNIYWKYTAAGYQEVAWEILDAWYGSMSQANAKDKFAYFLYPEFPAGFTITRSWNPSWTQTDWCQRNPGTTPDNFCITLKNTLGDISAKGNQCSKGDYEMTVTYTVTPPFARINGNIFIDYDGDGTKDAGVDTDYTGTTISLSGPSSGTQQAPNFDWQNLSPGSYTLNLAVPSGYVLTTPASNPISNTLIAGQTWTVPFGLSPRYTTDGSVCVDQNNNGIWDVGEPTYNNAFQITSSLGIINCPGDGLPSCPSPGAYRISNMITGTYAVTLSPITNYTFTAPISGSRSITVGPNQTGQNFCITPMLNISGNVLRDYNHNAANDLTEDTGLGGATVTATNGIITRNAVTNASGDYTITGLTPGTYTVTLTVPSGWTATYPSAPPNPKTVNLTASTSVNFMVTPYFTISGEVFIDNNKNRTKDNASENYLSSLPTPSITSTGGTVTYPATGTYKITTLLSGSYTISYVPPLGYGMTQPSPSTYIVTVGKKLTSIACSDPPVPPPGAASCYRDIATPPGTTDAAIDGSIENLRFGITRSFTWLQGTGGSMRIDSPTGFSNYIPDDTLKTLLPGVGGTHGVIYSGVGSADFCIDVGSCLIRSSANQWVVSPFTDTSGQNVSRFTPFNGLIRTSYAYFDSLFKQSGVTPTLLDTPQCGAGGRTNCNLATTTLPNGIYTTNGDLTLSGAASYSFPLNRDYIIVVNGNLNISQNISVPVGSTAIFAVKGNILVDQSVGEASAASTTINMAGFYSADGSFVLRGQNDCSLSPDRRLNVAGNITTNAALTGSGNKVEVQRDLCQGNLTSPVLSITERPDFLLNAPQFLKVNNFTSWKEIL